jgi:hypothetical protein
VAGAAKKSSFFDSIRPRSKSEATRKSNIFSLRKNQTVSFQEFCKESEVFNAPSSLVSNFENHPTSTYFINQFVLIVLFSVSPPSSVDGVSLPVERISVERNIRRRIRRGSALSE